MQARGIDCGEKVELRDSQVQFPGTQKVESGFESGDVFDE